VRKLLRTLHGNALAYECNNRKVMKNLSQDRKFHSRHLKRLHSGQHFVSCECEAWSFPLRGEYIPKGFENGLLRTIFGLQGEGLENGLLRTIFGLQGEGLENGLLRMIFGLHDEQKISVIHICTIKLKQL